MKKTICLCFLLALLLGMAACVIIPEIEPTTHASTQPPSEATASGGEPSVTDIPGLEFSDLTGLEFWFASGVGAWSTEVEILPDGSFNGYYHDSDMGDDGPGYPNGTMYECSFSGQFSPLKKIDAYTYSMQCESLKAEGTVGVEKIIDGIKVITSEPYGFDDADEFMLYLPGKSASELPAGFLDWSHESASSGVLTGYGLYNVAGQQGFIA